MLLTVDVGNTNTVLGIFKGEELVRSWRVKTDPRSTADELWLQYGALVRDYKVSALAICSTVPATLRELRTINRFAETPAIFLTAKNQMTSQEFAPMDRVLGIIHKPFDPVDLPKTIRSLYDGHFSL